MENINKKSFGKIVKEQREKLGLTQLQLSEELGLSQNFLGDIERGIKLPSIKKLICLSNTLKVSLDYLFIDSLDNVICEPNEIYYTDKQLKVMKQLIKTVQENFKD